MTHRLLHIRTIRASVLAAALLTATVAIAAASSNREQYHLTRVGEAAARAASLKHADFGTVPGWTGHISQPKSTDSTVCSTFNPKESDLIVNGDVIAHYAHTGLDIQSETQVLKTSKMVGLDWQRTFGGPGLLKCFRSLASVHSTAAYRFVSVRKLKFPRIAHTTEAFRFMHAVRSQGKIVHVVTDVVFFARGKTEITLSTTFPLAAESTLVPAEIRIAQVLAARIDVAGAGVQGIVGN